MLADHIDDAGNLPNSALLPGEHIAVGGLAPPEPPRASRLIWISLGLAITSHAVLIALALWSERNNFNAPDDTATPVELVDEVPLPPAIPKIQWPEAPSDFNRPDEPKKPDPPNFEKPKPEPLKPEQPKAEQPKTEQPKTEQPKPKQEPPKTDASKPDASKPSPGQTEPPNGDPPKADIQKPEQKAEPPAAGAEPPAAPPGAAKPLPAQSPRSAGANESILPPAYSEAPRRVLRTEREIYAPMAFELMPGTFRNKALTPEGQKEADDYKADVFASLEAAKRAPDAAKSLRAPVAVVVSFKIDLDGQIVSASVLRSSGSPTLDAEAIATVRRAAPFPPPPPQATRAFAPAIVFGPE